MESIYFTKCFLLPEARLCIREMFICFDKQLNVACFKKGLFYLSGSKIVINGGIKKEKKKSRPMKSNKREVLAPEEQHLLEISENVERISDKNTWLSDLAVLCSLNLYPK